MENVLQKMEKIIAYLRNSRQAWILAANPEEMYLCGE